VQVDPIKPKLKPPGARCFKLKCDEPLSNFAFKLNLRRYTKALAALHTAPPPMPTIINNYLSASTGSTGLGRGSGGTGSMQAGGGAGSSQILLATS
jgi:hypothetical protein